jgi:hypothetical protein
MISPLKKGAFILFMQFSFICNPLANLPDYCIESMNDPFLVLYRLFRSSSPPPLLIADCGPPGGGDPSGARRLAPNEALGPEPAQRLRLALDKP